MKLQSEFLEKVVQFLESQYNPSYFTKKEDYVRSLTHQIKDGFSTSWCLGGLSGNCWGEKTVTSAQPEPEFELLDDFLMLNYPDTSFFQYKKITRSIERTTDTNSDYYGGNTEYAKKVMHISALQNVLSDIGLEKDSTLVDVENFLKERAINIFASRKIPKPKNK